MKKSLILKSLIILLFSIFSIIMLTNNVEASTTGLSATSTEVTTGESVTVTASVNAGAWNLNLTGAGQTKGLVGQTNTTDNSSSSTSITFTPTTAGEYKFTLTGDVTDYITDANDLVDKSITIVAKEPAQIPPPATEPTTTTPKEPEKSSEARLSNFGIKPNDFTGFKRDKLEYSVEVPNDVAEVEIYGKKLHEKATVEGLGKVSLKEGSNTFEVKVTAEDGKTTKTYKLTIKRQTAEETEKDASESRLSNLGIKPEEYDFSGFSKDKTEYTAEVPNEIEEIEVYAKAVDSKAQITGTGIIELKEGENEIKVEVIAQNGEKKAYTIKVTRKVAEKTEEPVETEKDEEKFGLSTLTVAGFTLNPKFDVSTYEYKIDLKEDLTTLEITAKSTDKDATVEIIGNENLQQGETTITILVQNEETEENATYQIIVNKNVEQETVRASWLKPSTWGKEEIIKIAMVVVIIILIIIAVILKIQIAKDKKEEKKVDLPGADALDKALAEHQELAIEEQVGVEMQEEDFEANEEQQEAFAISEATKGEVQKFLEEFPQGESKGESQEVNANIATTEETRVSVDDLFNNDDFETRPRRKGRGKHF